MHDPMTVAFEIRYPWHAYPKAERTTDFKEGYRRSFITIWHVDPERGGSDDSCGWSFPEPPKNLVEKIKNDLDFLCREDSETDCSLVDQRRFEGSVAWWIGWLNRASYWDRKRGLSSREIQRFLFAWSFPGSRNDDVGAISGDLEHDRLAWILARSYLHHIRQWWQHPRWHFWHWKIQIHPLQDFKRWAFSRCSKCGGRFRWGYAPTTNAWNGTGPRWFRNEGNAVWHRECGSLERKS